MGPQLRTKIVCHSVVTSPVANTPTSESISRKKGALLLFDWPSGMQLTAVPHRRVLTFWSARQIRVARPRLTRGTLTTRNSTKRSERTCFGPIYLCDNDTFARVVHFGLSAVAEKKKPDDTKEKERGSQWTNSLIFVVIFGEWSAPLVANIAM